ncbi:MAG: Nif3-like dinuclear metal center hexameric protein [Pigmentiphaga sp.]
MSEQPSVSRAELERWLAGELRVARFRDYCPNGLQVAGTESIRHIVTGVTASLALLEQAVARGADAVLVHHGWFWKNDDPRIVGMLRNRLQLALRHDLNLFAYHLPLDAHPTLGNNAQLARVLGLEPETTPREGDDEPAAPLTLDADGLLWTGRAPDLDTVGDFIRRVEQRLGRAPLWVGEAEAPLAKVVWCTGGAQGYMSQAIDAEASLYLTGEASEYNTHLARETGVAFVAAGHHATERYGVQAVGQAVAERFGVTVEFVEIDNPV